MSHGKPPTWLVFLAARWKAVAALLVPLAGGLIALAPDSRAAQVIGAIITALVSAGIVHQVPNAGVAPVKDVVDAVVNAVPPGVANTVATAVTETTTGVLGPVVAPVTQTVGNLVADAEGAVTTLVGDDTDTGK